MAERVKIKVQESGTHIGVLSVQDAMAQVLDIFDVMTATAGGDDQLVWSVVFASKQNPFVIEAEAVSLTPHVNVDVIARAQKQTFERNYRAAIEGEVPVDWAAPKVAARATRFLTRNKNGIGRTDIELSPDKPPVIVTPSIAEVAIKALESHLPVSLFGDDRAREEIGSVEGRLLEVGSEYDQPAIKIEERTSREPVWCRVPPDVRDRIAGEANFKDVWEHRRVIVHGRIQYAKDGSIKRVHAHSVELVAPRTMTLNDIHDPDFTNGMRADEYLDRLREGDGG